ncbi:hypothetical protein F4820DRAFT_146731 [Hypoxylon rubiginosum]|uniref:Uncharacterized protein n=1 Tax=Hypoxylon rubiginosum TaxID=110542 RepID=A0ACB9ZHP2_9PEZI|nr:hypothetical protein F4820DRAFT_146731 [Hypoxylon rubiginosum]
MPENNHAYKRIVQAVNRSFTITRDIDPLVTTETEEELEEFWEIGSMLFREYLGDIRRQGVISVVEGTRTQIFSVPDPYDTEKRFLLYQSYFPSPGTVEEEMEFYRKFKTILASKFESEKSELGVNRGLMITLSSYEMRIAYFDDDNLIHAIASESIGSDVTRLVPGDWVIQLEL